MNKDKCENCGEELTDVEQQAKEDEKAEAWCCWECFGDGSEGITEHGKYIKLLAFVKRVSNNFCFTQTDVEGLQTLVNFENEAYKLLEEINELG